VSVVRLIVATRSSGPPASGKIIKEMPDSVAIGTHYINTFIINSVVFKSVYLLPYVLKCLYRGTDKSLARPGRKKGIATEDFDVHISYLLPVLVAARSKA
jgi:hypothetical protein